MMELGLRPAEFVTYVLIGALLSLCAIFPPQEFHTAGFTIPRLFQSLLGDERFSFVHYQLRRTSLNIFVHASLPFLFFLVLEVFFVPERVFSFYPVNILQFCALLSLLITIAAATLVYFMWSRDWSLHYVTQSLMRYDSDWRKVADEIDFQFRAPLNFTIHYNAYSRVIVTSEWLIRVSNYNVLFAQISDSDFCVSQSDRHPSYIMCITLQYLSSEYNGIQMIDICVRSLSNKFSPFLIRVYSQEMLNTLQDQLSRPVHISESFVLPLPLHERFVENFLETIEENPRVYYPDKTNLESCLGCSATTANIKLHKTCVDAELHQNESDDICRICNCRPMWCARCMGRIFASKQNSQTPETWMSGRAPCPTCRATFCVLDVCYLQ